MLTTRPKPRAVMPSTTCRHMLNTPSRLMFSTASQSVRSILRSVPSRVMPAALTRMSTAPRSASTLRTSAPQASKSPTLPDSKWMSRPSTSRRNSAMRSSREPRSVATTVRPARARVLQISVPRPPMPPVTTATRLLIGSPGWFGWCGLLRCNRRVPVAGPPRQRSDGGEGTGRSCLGLVLFLVLLARAVRRGAAHAADEVLLEVLPQLQVLLGQLVEHGPRRLADQTAHLLAELLLLLEEHLHRALQVAPHEPLQRIPVEPDDLAQQLGGQHRFAVLFVLRDDLQEHAAGEVFPGLGVADLELLAVDDELAHILDRDVAGDPRVVQTTVRIFLDDACCWHCPSTPDETAGSSMAQCSSELQQSCQDPQVTYVNRSWGTI